jgi:TAT (twin-arginine translocation) pathway signal sequence
LRAERLTGRNEEAEMARFTRRQFLRYGAAGGAVLFLPLRVGARQALAQVPGGTLPPGGIPKYETPLVIPPAMPRTAAPPAVRGADYYEIAVRQFRQHILPQSM